MTMEGKHPKSSANEAATDEMSGQEQERNRSSLEFLASLAEAKAPAHQADDTKESESIVNSKDLRPDDVLLGRGTGPNDYEGNVRFRVLIRDVIKTSGVKDSKDSRAKTKLAAKIVETVKERDGRFLQRAAGTPQPDTWSTQGTSFVVVPDQVALDKTKQSLRHQLRILIDPNYKENRDKRLKLKKLREQILQQASVVPTTANLFLNNLVGTQSQSNAHVAAAELLAAAAAGNQRLQEQAILSLTTPTPRVNIADHPSVGLDQLLRSCGAMPAAASTVGVSHHDSERNDMAAKLISQLLAKTSVAGMTSAASPSSSILGTAGTRYSSQDTSHHLSNMDQQLARILLSSQRAAGSIGGSGLTQLASSSTSEHSNELQALLQQLLKRENTLNSSQTFSSIYPDTSRVAAAYFR